MKRALLTSLVLIAIIGILFAIYPRSRPVKGIPTPPTTIAIQPFASIAIQPFASVSDGVVDSVESAIRAMYGFEVVVLEKVDLPDMAYTTIRFPRYRADSLLRWLVATKPDSVNIVIGLTDKDISTTKYRKGTDEIKKEIRLTSDTALMSVPFCRDPLGDQRCCCNRCSVWRQGKDRQDRDSERIRRCEAAWWPPSTSPTRAAPPRTSTATARTWRGLSRPRGIRAIRGSPRARTWSASRC